MSAPTVIRDLVVAHTRVLKLPGVARTFEGLARQARDSHWPHEDYLHEVLSAEQASRHESVIRQRLREARFPEVKTLDTFDFAAADGVNATQIHTLARGEWVTAPENLIFAGPIGTGKTHLAIALGVEATKQKRRVLFTRAADLVRQLLEARDTRELTRLQQRLLRVDVLIVDELGFVPFDRVGGELLFNLLTDRYERRATVVTTNLAFAEWVTVFAGDEKLTTALLDRLAHHATVLTTKGKSYRMRKRRGRESRSMIRRHDRGSRRHVHRRRLVRALAGRGRLTLSWKNRRKESVVLSSRSDPRRMNRPPGGLLSERRTGLLSERRNHVQRPHSRSRRFTLRPPFCTPSGSLEREAAVVILGRPSPYISFPLARGVCVRARPAADGYVVHRPNPPHLPDRC